MPLRSAKPIQAPGQCGLTSFQPVHTIISAQPALDGQQPRTTSGPGAGSNLNSKSCRLADTKVEQGVSKQLHKEGMPLVGPLQGPTLRHSPNPVVVPCGRCENEIQHPMQDSPAEQALATSLSPCCCSLMLQTGRSRFRIHVDNPLVLVVLWTQHMKPRRRARC